MKVILWHLTSSIFVFFTIVSYKYLGMEEKEKVVIEDEVAKDTYNRYYWDGENYYDYQETIRHKIEGRVNKHLLIFIHLFMIALLLGSIFLALRFEIEAFICFTHWFPPLAPIPYFHIAGTVIVLAICGLMGHRTFKIVSNKRFTQYTIGKRVTYDLGFSFLAIPYLCCILLIFGLIFAL